MSPDPSRAPTELLPLKPDVFLILTILTGGDQYGYGLMQAAEAMSGGRVKLQAGALYRRLRWMLDEELIREVEARPGRAGEDERRRYYRVTPFGKKVAHAEARRMAELLEAARHVDMAIGTKEA